MENTAIYIALALVFLGLVVLAVVLRLPRNYPQNLDPTPEKTSTKSSKKCHLECSKVALFVLLFVWSVGSLVGLWVVLFQDVGKLEVVYSFISGTVTVGLGAYYAKAGAENWKKSSVEEKNEEMKGEEDEYQ